MRPQITPAAAGLAMLALGLPGAAAAQSQYCLDYVDSVCGGLPVNQCVVAEDIGYVFPQECIGDVQMLFEMAREYEEQVYQDQAYGCDPTYGCDPPVNATQDPLADQGGYDVGYSFGGNLRGGPSDRDAVVGSLPEGAWVSLQGSGVWSGGYQWFYVSSDYGTAYHWGGLICSMDYYVDGVLQTC